jgi:dihydroxyacetone kinase
MRALPSPEKTAGSTLIVRLWDTAQTLVEDSLGGFCDVHGALVRRVPGGVVRAALAPESKVAVVIGGGSGHYPAFSGYVGQGLADAAVVGNVFASPSARQVADVARSVAGDAGVVLGFGNYAGDVLNFGLAAERLRDEGIETVVLAVTDDIASAAADRAADRRGVAGDVVVFKVVGAAAEAGYGLADVERVGRLANDRTRSFGVAFSGCTLPGASEPLFSLPPGHMGVGLGIHGEPGVSEEPVMPAGELARLLVERILDETPVGSSNRAVALLNGLGATKYEELFGLWRHVSEGLRAAGLELVDPEVGELVTSLDMAGCSLTVSWLTDEALELWCAPAHAPALRRGAPIPAPPPRRPAGNGATPRPAARRPVESSDDSAHAARRVVEALDLIARALAAAEDELGRIDARAGDGDHGAGMRMGSQAALAAAARARADGAGVATVLVAAADAWADGAGGTSGALWGAALRASGRELSDAAGPGPDDIVRACQAALDAVVTLGGAQPGDKTLVDALAPFVAALREQVRTGAPVHAAWRAAADAATAAAEATAALEPRLGRARPLAERSLGHPDAGAVSLALCARTAVATTTPEEHANG